MKKQLNASLMALALMLALGASAFAQAGLTKVAGMVKDEAGQPIVGATIELIAANTGRKYTTKTDKKGYYIQLGVAPGPYKIVLSKEGKTLWTLETNAIRLTPEDLVTIDLDLKKERAAAQAAGTAQMSEEEKKERERVSTENAKIGNLNKLLAQGSEQLKAENFDAAITSFKTATDADPNRDLLWARLGDAYIAAAKKETDSAARKEKYGLGAAAYNKALAIATKPPAEGAAPNTIKPGPSIAAYYNNMAEALGKSGDVTAALAAYDKAAENDPANAAMFYFNKGATLTNANRADEAIAAFTKVNEVAPDRADAYYLKGTNLLSKATMKGSEIVPAAGTAEAFNKYLELEPDGPYSQQAKDMLAAIGAKVETTYRSRKGSKK
jgi:tetratricopeptide (TPR) repeat protein